MSEQHQRGAWGGGREDNGTSSGTSTWWSADQQSVAHQQQLLNQHHQQQLAAAVQQQQAAEVARSTAAAAANQIFSYNMAANNNFSKIISSANTANINSSPNQTNAGMRYDYSGGAAAAAAARPADAALANQAAVAWWYNQQQQQQQQGNSVGVNLQNNANIQLNHLQNANAVNMMNRGRMPKTKPDAKPRGRMTAYAYFVQICREEHKKKHPDESVVFKEFSRKCAERWKTMSDKEKKRFHDMADKDKKRYDSEMQNYIPPKGEKGARKRRKQIKDPNAPKRSLSAFFWFCSEERGAIKASNPDYGVGDIAKELGRKWADCDPSIKARFEGMAERDKARYEKEMIEYKRKSKAGPPMMEQARESDGDDLDDDDNDDDE